MFKIQAKAAGQCKQLLKKQSLPKFYQQLYLLVFVLAQDHTFAEKVLSAMRYQFGGHVETKETNKKMTSAISSTVAQKQTDTNNQSAGPCALVIFGAAGD